MRFASSHLVCFGDFDEAPMEQATIAAALALAHYYACVRGRADSIDYIDYLGDMSGAEELAINWNFDVEQYYAWKDRDDVT
ncbi:MAG: hypothetical protein QGG36_02420 [Pirellulaceae bacterium]|jgi:hypothetical protein|nr:hypothetical protein [Pirellulaceae bacterium]